MKSVIRRLSQLERPLEFFGFFAMIVVMAALLGELRQWVVPNAEQRPFIDNLLRSAFTSVPLAAFGTAILIHTSVLRR